MFIPSAWRRVAFECMSQVHGNHEDTLHWKGQASGSLALFEQVGSFGKLGASVASAEERAWQVLPKQRV